MHRLPNRHVVCQKLVLLVCLLALGAPASPSHAALGLPPIPEDGHFIQDYADIIPPAIQSQIGPIQQEAFEQHDTPIVIVTIGSMAEYGGAGYSIERFATEWFDQWEIGKRDEEGELINQGILLLISLGDREARIELGADWGDRWDDHAARIMNRAILPEFRDGNYGQGALSASAAFLEMAELGPQASPPRGLTRLLEGLDDEPLPTTPLPLWGIGLAILVGIGLIVASFFFPEHRKMLLIAGIAIIVGALILWVLLAILALVMRGQGGSGGGFSSGGGFGTGGFSGGGGASGSW